MKKFLTVAFFSAAAVLAGSSAASAGGIVEACYMKSYVPAKYAYGKQLLKGEWRAWTNLDNGPGLVTRIRHPATFIQTARKVANDHYILVPVSCN